MKKSSTFAGAPETKNYYLFPIDSFIKQALLPFIPRFVQTNHVTLSMLAFALLNVILGLWMQERTQFLFLFALSITITHILDLLDGELGRQRHSGLELWGFYMDKVVDFVVLAGLGIGLLFVFSSTTWLVMLIILLYGAIMLQAMAYQASTAVFHKTYNRIGPTEAKFALIAVFLVGSWLNSQTLFWILLITAAVLTTEFTRIVYRSQKRLWELDTKNKA